MGSLRGETRGEQCTARLLKRILCSGREVIPLIGLRAGAAGAGAQTPGSSAEVDGEGETRTYGLHSRARRDKETPIIYLEPAEARRRPMRRRQSRVTTMARKRA